MNVLNKLFITEAGIIGFPKPNYVFKENDGFAVVPVHRTVGMDGKVQASWFTRDITARDGEHYQGGRGIVVFNDGEVCQKMNSRTRFKEAV